MNDCFWSFISECCTRDSCEGCSKYIGVNTSDGHKMLEQYQKEVDAALAPVINKWKALQEK